MKTLKIYLCMLAVALCAVACSDDDDETPVYDLISGTYSGYTSAAFVYSSTPIITEDETVTISGDASSVTLTYTSDTWGTATFTDVTVTTTTSGYTLSGSGTAAMASHSGGTSTYDCTVSGTISSDKSAVDLVVTYPSVMGGTTITFALGDAPAYLKLAGSYDSYSVATFMGGMSKTSDGESITLTANTDSQTLDLSYDGTWGTGSAEGLTITEESDGSYTLSGAGQVQASMSGSSVGTYDFTVTGSISSDKSTVTFTFTIAMGAMGTVTVVTNLGTAPTTEE